MKIQTLIGSVLLIAIVAIALVYITRNPETEEAVRVTSFEECVEAGFPVMESYPEQCSDGEQTFTRDIGNELEKSDLIKIYTPRPGDTLVAGESREISGEARGYWFFEGDFPLEIVDPSGEQLLVHYATAEGEWMTEEFVPFKTEVVLETTYEGPASLILRRNNPSDLSENDDELIVPIVIEVPPGYDLDTTNGDEEPLSEASDKTILAECFVGGCSGQICSDNPDVVTTCEWREEYGCYKNATCERQANGECGWTETEELSQCLAGAQANLDVSL